MKRFLSLVLCVAVLASFASASFARVRAKDPLKNTNGAIVKVGEDITINENANVKDAVAIRGDIYVKGSVAEDVVAVLGTVHLLPTAKVGGDAVSIGGNVIKHDGAQVGGNIVEVAPGMQGALPFITFLAVVGIAIIMLMVAVGIVALSLVVAAFFTKQVGTISSRIERNPWKSLFWGILGWVLVVPVALVLAVSIIGIPLIVVETILLSCALILGGVAASQLVGKKITQAIRKPNQPMLVEVVVGLVIIFLVGLVPILGGLVKCLIVTAGLGAAMTTRLGYKSR